MLMIATIVVQAACLHLSAAKALRRIIRIEAEISLTMIKNQKII